METRTEERRSADRQRLAREASEVTEERLALWHDYPWTEAGESLLVNAEWHGPRCRSNVTRLYIDCDCTLVGAVVAIEVEAAIAHRLLRERRDTWVRAVDLISAATSPSKDTPEDRDGE